MDLSFVSASGAPYLATADRVRVGDETVEPEGIVVTSTWASGGRVTAKDRLALVAVRQPLDRYIAIAPVDAAAAPAARVVGFGTSTIRSAPATLGAISADAELVWRAPGVRWTATDRGAPLIRAHCESDVVAALTTAPDRATSTASAAVQNWLNPRLRVIAAGTCTPRETRNTVTAECEACDAWLSQLSTLPRIGTESGEALVYRLPNGRVLYVPRVSGTAPMRNREREYDIARNAGYPTGDFLANEPGTCGTAREYVANSKDTARFRPMLCGFANDAARRANALRDLDAMASVVATSGPVIDDFQTAVYPDGSIRVVDPLRVWNGGTQRTGIAFEMDVCIDEWRSYVNGGVECTGTVPTRCSVLQP